MNDSNYSKLTFSWEDQEPKENLNNAILLSSNEAILSKSSDDIFYDTNEFSFSGDYSLTATDMSNVSEEEEYKSCSDLSGNTDSTSLLSLPRSKSNLKKVTADDDLAPDQQNLKIYETDKDVPLKVVLKRMLDEILGKRTEETSRTCSVNEFSSSIAEINNNNPLYQIPKNDDPCLVSESVKDSGEDNILPSHDISVPVADEWYRRDLETIPEYSNESSGVSSLQSTLNWSGKCLSRLTNFSFKKLSKHWIHDKIFITSEIGDSISSESNTSTDIAMIAEEIFERLNDLKDASLNSTDHNRHLLHANEQIIITSSINKKEYKLLKLRNHKVPFIVITPASPI